MTNEQIREFKREFRIGSDVSVTKKEYLDVPPSTWNGVIVDFEKEHMYDDQYELIILVRQEKTYREIGVSPHQITHWARFHKK